MPSQMRSRTTTVRRAASRLPGGGIATCSRAWKTNVPKTRRMGCAKLPAVYRSEEHTSELQSLMRISYAVFCLKKKNATTHHTTLISTQYQIELLMIHYKNTHK